MDETGAGYGSSNRATATHSTPRLPGRARWGYLLNNRVDNGGGLSSQSLIPWLSSVHLQDVCGYLHNFLIVGETGLLKRELGLLKARHKFAPQS